VGAVHDGADKVFFMSSRPKNRNLKGFKRILRSPAGLLGGGILAVAVILALLIYFDVHEQILQLLTWFETLGFWAPLLFILMMALVVVLLLPGALLTTGAGFVFGIVEGSIVVILGTTLGAGVAFLVARYLFREGSERFVRKYERLRLLGEELSDAGWKIVLLTRLIPFFPSKVSNYFFGLTSLSFRGYLLGSLIGFIPFSIHNVYLGSLAADIVTLKQRNLQRTPLEWGVYGLGFVATVCMVIYLNRLARRALARQLSENSDEVTP
jgi:uncharacterized membrane protein YdjX (TVP38/TMEM64 family)